ncbi:hypothetical protein [Kocuria flava]|uniref:hypothetical protein n=1 Tax=Kocuria flava TaxID=446860 RepID=UPI000AB200CD|nr:hypothetical protein [Kocuria flava]
MGGRGRAVWGGAAAGLLVLAGGTPAQAAGQGAVTAGNQPYEVQTCYDDMLGNRLCTTLEGRALQVVLPNGRQLNRDRGTHTSEGYTWDGLYYREAGTHHSFTVYEQYTSPWEWDDQVTRVDATTTLSFENGDVCVISQTFVQVDGQARNGSSEVVCN